MTRPLIVFLAALMFVLSVADSADAQRRRRRRRRRARTTTEQVTPTPEVVEADSPADASGSASAADATPDPNAESAGPAAEVAETPSEESSTEAVPAPMPAYDPGPPLPDVAPIRADYVTLMDELVEARMRVSALGSQLFHTRMRIVLQDRTGDGVNLARMVIHLDGAPIFQVEGSVEGGDSGAEVFTGALAPGPHVLTLEAEQRSREDDAYRYTLRESFRFLVVRDRLSDVSLVLEDGSDMAQNFPSGGEGRYEVRTRMRVASRELPQQ